MFFIGGDIRNALFATRHEGVTNMYFFLFVVFYIRSFSLPKNGWSYV